MSTYKLIDDEEQAPLCESESSLTVSQEMVQSECLKTTRLCSGICGIFLGIFIQGSSLALNFMISSSVEITTMDVETYTILMVLWSFLSSLLGVGVLLLMRSLVIVTFYSTNDDVSSEALEQKEDFMILVIDGMQKCYTFGALGGLGLAWTISDFLLGVQGHMYQSLLTVMVAVVWYILSPK